MREYVMVPVPEELAEEVENRLKWGWLISTEPPRWTREAATELVTRADEAGRRLLVAVASARKAGREATINELAAAAGCNPRETVGLISELNQLVKLRDGHAGIVMVIHDAAEADAEAALWDRRAVAIPEDIAELVLEAAQSPA